jgi:hypothetical protein
VFDPRHNCRWLAILLMFGLFLIGGYEAGTVKVRVFRTIPLGPANRPKPPETRSPPGGPSIFGGFIPATGCQENTHVPKMGKQLPIYGCRPMVILGLGSYLLPGVVSAMNWRARLQSHLVQRPRLTHPRRRRFLAAVFDAGVGLQRCTGLLEVNA